VRKYVVADIRGDIDLLKQLMDSIGPVESDYFLFTGSYLGPGKDSKAVMDFLIDFKAKQKCNFLMGCYECLFGEVIALTKSGQPANPSVIELWKALGGSQVLESYAKDTDLSIVLTDGKIQRISMPFVIPEPHIKFLQHDLHLWYLDSDYPVAAYHAGPDPKNFQNPSMEAVTIGVNGWWESDWHLPDTKIVFSHIPFPKPWTHKGKIGIDLGAGIGGSKLCAYEMKSDSFTIVGN